jgi:hypothetical protein
MTNFFSESSKEWSKVFDFTSGTCNYLGSQVAVRLDKGDALIPRPQIGRRAGVEQVAKPTSVGTWEMVS